MLSAACVRKTIDSKPNVPNIRACPKCAMMLQHTTACKHMTCGRNGHSGLWIGDQGCKHQFCFICLQNWAGHNSSNCRVHPPQVMKDLPKSVRASTFAKECQRTPDFSTLSVRKGAEKPAAPTQWACRACTFLNPLARSTCEMCNTRKS